MSSQEGLFTGISPAELASAVVVNESLSISNDCGSGSGSERDADADADAPASSNATVIIDVRGIKAFSECCIKGAMTVRLSKLLMRRLHGGRISIDDVIVDHEGAWKARSPNALIVCYDDQGCDQHTEYNPSDALHVIMKSLTKTNANAVFLSGV